MGFGRRRGICSLKTMDSEENGVLDCWWSSMGWESATAHGQYITSHHVVSFSSPSSSSQFLPLGCWRSMHAHLVNGNPKIIGRRLTRYVRCALVLNTQQIVCCFGGRRFGAIRGINKGPVSSPTETSRFTPASELNSHCPAPVRNGMKTR